MANLAVLDTAIAKLEALSAKYIVLSDADEQWLSALKEHLTVGQLEVSISAKGDADSNRYVDLLSIGGLQQSSEDPQALAKLIDGLKAVRSASLYKPAIRIIGSIKLPIHNELIGQRLRASYSSKQFQELCDFCESKGVFALRIDPKQGLIETSDVQENWDMSGRRWVTDTIRCGDIERVVDPQAWQKALLTLLDFYSQPEEVEATDNSIRDPNFYRQGGLTNGIAHIFLPDTLKRDASWSNNKRLESHALALKAFCDTLIDGLVHHKPYGFDGDLLANAGRLAKIAQVISNLATYLKAINTDPQSGVVDFSAPSAGCWEEIPFADGLTWDTEATRSAFESLRELMFSDAYKQIKAMVDVRKALSATKYGAWLKEPSTLNELIDRAHKKVMNRLFQSPEPMENPQRPFDSSLAFISTSTIQFADSMVGDVSRHFYLLNSLERHLLRDNGMIRYAPFNLKLQDGRTQLVCDSYLADNYWLFPQLRVAIAGRYLEARSADAKNYGSSDCSSEDDYLTRVRLARPGTEAEWCWVAVMAEAYTRQNLKLLKSAAQKGRALTNEEYALLAAGQQKATEFINRSYARIAGRLEQGQLCKANGQACPEFVVPEAYEHVSTFDDLKQTKLLPGANTPLAWGVASLFSASQLFRESLELAEEILKQPSRC